MPDEKQPQKLKVTDKRMFTSDGEVRPDWAEQAPTPAPASPAAPKQPEPPAPAPQAVPEPPRPQATPQEPAAERPKRSDAEKAENPGTPFSMFVETLIFQAYMSLGMIKDPYNPQGRPNPNAARQMIDILTMLREKTSGNLTIEEEDFLTTHLGELKLAFVQRTKSIG